MNVLSQRTCFFVFLKDVNFANFYNGTSNVFVSADHSSKGGNLNPVHIGITTWVEVRLLIYFTFSLSTVLNNVTAKTLVLEGLFSHRYLIPCKFVLFYSMSIGLAFVFVSKNYLRQNTTLCTLLTLYCQVGAQLFYIVELFKWIIFIIRIKPAFLILQIIVVSNKKGKIKTQST